MPSSTSLTRVGLRFHTSASTTTDVREHLRQLLRETAQTVAVVTARLLPLVPTASASTRSAPTPPTPVYHGATLSSFTSIALDPLPLVAFSLRVPSRMASALNTHVASSTSRAPSSHLVINILSAAQPDLADRFARSDRYPRPFADPLVRYTLSQDGLPMLAGALGALSCQLVGRSLPLAHLQGVGVSDEGLPGEGGGGVGAREGGWTGEGETQQVSGGTGLASELFIARVVRVERVSSVEDDGQDRAGPHRLPLLYHRRQYTSVRDPTKP